MSDELEEALQHKLGQKGLVLKAVLDYESARFDDLRMLAPADTSAQEIYAAAIAWARNAGVELEPAEPVPLTP